jgi:CRP-like cAMP-binding protein
LQIVDALRTSPLLAALGDEQLAGLARVARERTFGSGETMIEEGKERAQAMFVILEGTAEVRTGGRTVASLEAGDHVGEMALVLADQTRTADVVATSDVRVVQLSRWDFLPYLKTNPDVALAVIAELAQRLDDANRRDAST